MSRRAYKYKTWMAAITTRRKTLADNTGHFMFLCMRRIMYYSVNPRFGNTLARLVFCGHN